jgi:hypothetical protein
MKDLTRAFFCSKSLSRVGCKKMEKNPIIITGMHRAGTTMLSQILEKKGFFLGVNKDRNNESKHLITINNWLLNSVGARWDYPKNIDVLIENDKMKKMVTDYLHEQVMGLNGKVKYWGGRTQRLWGWKDPRNTFTLPIWLKVFPEAKVINITREPMDVAASLYKRTQLNLEKTYSSKFKRQVSNLLGNKKGIFIDSVRCLEIERTIELWIDYTKLSLENESLLDKGRFLSLKYEDILTDKTIQDEINVFLGGKVMNACDIHADFNINRLNAYTQDENLILLREKYQSDFRNLGY